MTNAPTGFRFPIFLLQLSIITVILFLLQKYLTQSFFRTTNFYFETWQIYLFQFVSVATLIYFLQHRSKIKPDKVLNTFVILSLLKMAAVIVFLLPLFFNKSMDSKPTVFSFFIPYFIFLIIESNYALKILNEKK
jgi:hypothetical protein